MFAIVSKMLTPLAAPLGLSLVLWAGAALLLLRGRRRGGIYCGAAGVAVVLFFGCPLVGETMLETLEDDFEILEPGHYPRVDAIVVLGGITAPPVAPRYSVEVTDAFDRLLHGMRLYREGCAERIVLSGGTIPELSGSELSEAEAMRRLAREYGIPEQALLLETRSRNTYENALYSRLLLEEQGLKRVLLVTSASHMWRSAAVFRSQGVECVPAPVDVRVVSRPFSWMQLLPTTGGLEDSSVAAKEYVGYWVYWLRGWIR